MRRSTFGQHCRQGLYGRPACKNFLNQFEMIADPCLPGHLLLQQYQAQLLSAVQTALDSSSGHTLLDSGLQMASKIKIRLLAAHASLKCYAYGLLRREENQLPEKFQALLALFSKNSDVLGVYWLSVLKDCFYICCGAHPEKEWKHFLEWVQSSLVSCKLQPCLVEACPVILQALVLDAAPGNFVLNGTPVAKNRPFISDYSMVELSSKDYYFMWGFCLLALFQGQDIARNELIIPMCSVKSEFSDHFQDTNALCSKFYEIGLLVIQSLNFGIFFTAGFVTMDACREFLQVKSFVPLLFVTMDACREFLQVKSFVPLLSLC